MECRQCRPLWKKLAIPGIPICGQSFEPRELIPFGHRLELHSGAYDHHQRTGFNVPAFQHGCLASANGLAKRGEIFSIGIRHCEESPKN